MGTWVRINGQINVNLGCAYRRFSENPCVYEYYVNMKNRIKKWVDRAYRKHLSIGLPIDCGCDVLFIDRQQSHRNEGYDFFSNPSDLSEYNYCTIVLHVWDRNGDFNNGSAFIEDVFHKLRTNGIEIEFGTFVTVQPDYSSTALAYTPQGRYSVDFESIPCDNTYKLSKWS